MSNSSKGLTIGVLARAAGVNVETVRYYQRIGLIAEPPRPAQGYRHYPREAVTRLRFIKRAQELGFSLREIRELLQLNDGHCATARHMAEQKLARVHERLADLQRMRETLESMVDACHASEEQGHPCALIEALTRPEG
ncbi:MAG TPA: Hg(II)-responsive transcriptional regulator [Gammaproteobacteria bacterium]|nr:Hg(II)-responsive transcriptional regulator [Gammaproteobacteria bacterium]